VWVDEDPWPGITLSPHPRSMRHTGGRSIIIPYRVPRPAANNDSRLRRVRRRSSKHVHKAHIRRFRINVFVPRAYGINYIPKQQRLSMLMVFRGLTTIKRSFEHLYLTHSLTALSINEGASTSDVTATSCGLHTGCILLVQWCASWAGSPQFQCSAQCVPQVPASS
jgi:hypothetical protein